MQRAHEPRIIVFAGGRAIHADVEELVRLHGHEMHAVESRDRLISDHPEVAIRALGKACHVAIWHPVVRRPGAHGKFPAVESPRGAGRQESEQGDQGQAVI